MRAAVWESPGELAVQERPDPSPGPDEIVVRVGACGMCGTDVHIAEGEFPPTPYPIVPGHEFAGEVVEIGSDVEDVAVGAHVAVDPSLFCGHCDYCRVQRGNLCRNWNAIGDTVDGAFAELVKAPARNAYELPEGTAMRAGALVEPLACAVHGARRLDVGTGDSVLITGSGTMGLLLLQLLSQGGAASVTVVDRNEKRLEVARSLGADAVQTDVAALSSDHPDGFDVVVDATGVPPVIQQGLGAVRRGGKLMVFGVAPEEARVEFSPFRIYNDEVTIVGSMAVLYTFVQAIELLRGGTVQTEPLLTHTFPLDGFEDALSSMRAGEGIKVQVLPNS
ncbi:MAG TPA: zinc-dependent alcohol dehydrogenase family protein [Solirubrobacteraceae bacterium]|nr:zinc-dependent alcohol dehydrogenase family protein [Solirubrobacteraceae bacterium]